MSSELAGVFILSDLYCFLISLINTSLTFLLRLVLRKQVHRFTQFLMEMTILT